MNLCNGFNIVTFFFHFDFCAHIDSISFKWAVRMAVTHNSIFAHPNCQEKKMEKKNTTMATKQMESSEHEIKIAYFERPN